MNQIRAMLGSDTGAGRYHHHNIFSICYKCSAPCEFLTLLFLAKEVLELWNEYEAGASPEALLVKDFDKLEMIIQV
jgi:hypothetical protein